jgi:hypothetical protein
VATSANPLPKRRQPILPLPNAFLRRKAVFDEQQLTAGFEHATHLVQRADGIWNRA